MLQKNCMGNRQHCYIWVTNGPPAENVKNRYHEEHNHKLYNPSLRWTQAKTHPNEVTWNLRASVYLFILLWLSTTAVELKPTGPKSCRVLDAVWLEGPISNAVSGLFLQLSFHFYSFLEIALKEELWAKENCFKTLGCKSLLILQNPVLMLPSETTHHISLPLFPCFFPRSSPLITYDVELKDHIFKFCTTKLFFRYTTWTRAKRPKSLPVWLSSCSFVFLSPVRKT